MTEPTATETTPPLSLLSRIIGVITSPKATYARVVAAPRPVGVLFVCALAIGIGITIPQMTEPARQQALGMQVKVMERFGVPVTPEAYQQMEARSRNKVFTALGALQPLIGIPILALVLTSLFWVFFNAILGGTATFKQVLAVTSHSYVITALAVLLTAPVLYYRFEMSMGGPYSLGALVSFLDEGSALARFLRGVSIFSIWAWINVSIGLGVLYRRNSRTISIVLLLLFIVFTYAMTSIFGSFFGGA